jgi:hypothetical protein
MPNVAGIGALVRMFISVGCQPQATTARFEKPGPESGPGIRYIVRRNPPCPYGIAYRRVYVLSFRWTVPFSLGSGTVVADP